jgi:Aerotolerance regulator N-terminal/von Willebrand factor type A domain
LTFLNPFVLFGLAAAAIPILLHVFNLRKLQTIEFSTLSFLKELQKTKIRRLKLRQLLLLFLRTLLVILIVLAFSRPTMKGSIPGGLSEQAKTTAVILFDDSQSMTASDEQGELLRQAKNSAESIINLLKDGDEVFLVKLSDIPTDGTKEIPSSERNFPAIRSTLKDIKPSSFHRTIEDALRFTSRLLASSKNFNKEVYVISDFQSGSLESKLNVSKTAEQLFAPTTQFFLVPLGKRELQNVGVEFIEIPNTIFEVNKPFIVKAKLVNYGTSDMQNHVVSIYQDGNRVAQKGVDIRAGQSVETDFTLVPKHTGFLEGIIELEDDELEFDNRRFFTVHIPEEIRGLLVGNSSDLTYLRLALSTRLSDTSASLKMTESTFNRLSASLLSNIDVIVLSDPPEPTSSQMSILKTYLQNGGGILIFPGAHTLVNSFNMSFVAALGISTIAAVDSLSGTSQAAVEFEKIDLRHPLFAEMFEKDGTKQPAGTVPIERSLESPRVLKSIHFIPTPHSKTVITLSNGYPFLIEERIGNGRALMFSIAANTEWSDLPLKGLFVPLMHRSLAYLVQEPITDHSLIIGDEKTIRIRSSIAPALTVTKPGGMEVLVNTQQRPTDKTIRFSDTDINGFYIIKSGNLILDKFAVNIDPDESNTTPSSEKRQEKMLMHLGIANNVVHTVHQQQEVQRVITESRLGAELWKQFLIAALFIAVIEMFVARDSKRSLTIAATPTNG